GSRQWQKSWRANPILRPSLAQRPGHTRSGDRLGSGTKVNTEMRAIGCRVNATSGWGQGPEKQGSASRTDTRAQRTAIRQNATRQERGASHWVATPAAAYGARTALTSPT